MDSNNITEVIPFSIRYPMGSILMKTIEFEALIKIERMKTQYTKV